MISSPEINKAIRRSLSPQLKQNGFTRVQTRRNWGWRGPCTWVLELRAVGAHFGAVTGWPPMSIGVWIGVFYDFVPRDVPVVFELSPEAKPLPREWDCPQRSHLDIGLDQRRYRQQLNNPAEKARTDIWWVEPDGGNLEEVMEDITHQFLAQGLFWFERMTDIHAVYTEIEREHECFDKFSRAAYFAKYLGRDEEYQDYRSRMEKEAHRVGRAEWLAQYP